MRFNGGFKELIYGRVSRPASSNNHALIWLPEHLLLSPTGMKTYRPVSLRRHVGQHTTKRLPRSSRLSVPLLPGLAVGPKLYHYRQLSFLESSVFRVTSDR